MEDSIKNTISVLAEYWNDPKELDPKIRNTCRLLANIISGRMSKEAFERITRNPEDSGELETILIQVSRTDPNSIELISSLLVNRAASKLQSVNVTGNNNQVISAGGNIFAGTINQNNSVTSRKMSASKSNSSNDSVPPQWQEVGDYERAVFVSYAWGGESERTVDDLEKALAEYGIHIVRDKKDLGYKGSIKSFEQRIGQGQCILLVISDKYLRSEHCMYELVEVDDNRGLRERVFPIVLADACIYQAIDRLNYIKYWDEKIEQLNRAIKEIDVVANLASITTALDKYTRIRTNFDHLTDLLSDMNTLTPEIHAANGYSTLISALTHAILGKE